MPVADLLTPETNAPLMDRELALSRVGGDEELLKELAGLFLEEYPRLMEELRAALQAGDAKQVERVAHGLKGSVANFGVRRAMDAAASIEHMGRGARLEPVAEALQSLDLLLLSLHQELLSL